MQQNEKPVYQLCIALPMQTRCRAQVFTDNMAVVNQYHAPKLPRRCFKQWSKIRAISGQHQLQLEWIPSHGKYPDWRPTDGRGHQEPRSLNETADIKAGIFSERQSNYYNAMGPEEGLAASRLCLKALARLEMGATRFLSAKPELSTLMGWVIEEGPV